MNKQNSPTLFMPSDDSLQSEEFHKYFRKNIQYFSAGNRLYVWINAKRCFEYMTKAQAMILMDSLIDRHTKAGYGAPLWRRPTRS